MIKVEIIITKVRKPIKYKRFKNFLRVIRKHVKHFTLMKHHIENKKDVGEYDGAVYEYGILSADSEPYDDHIPELMFHYPDLGEAYAKLKDGETLNNAVKRTLIFKDFESADRIRCL